MIDLTDVIPVTDRKEFCSFRDYCVALFLVLVLLPCSVTAVHAIGTEGGSLLENALPTDTVPLKAGEMSVRYENSAGGDTTYVDTSTSLSTEVDTGYDMWNIDDTGAAGTNVAGDSFTWDLATHLSANFHRTGGAVGGPSNNDTFAYELTPGDSAVFAFNIHNRSNNSAAIPYKFSNFINSGLAGGGTDSNDSFALELFVTGGDSRASEFDSAASEVRRAGNGETTAVYFAAEEIKTIFAVLTVKPDAANQDTTIHRVFATDDAPVSASGGDPSYAGDQWERHRSISGRADYYDSQAVWLECTVRGPKLNVEKSLQSLQEQGGFRPGDTVLYTITVENTGSDTATNVELMDAMPTNTTYVANSATDTDNGNGGATIQFDDSVSGTFTSGDGDDSGTRRIKWIWDTVGPTENSTSVVKAEFKVTID